ncbi:MAG TPA: glycosyltransferase family 4 protein [Aggregatilineaceae bacterium]|jgi:glycosyltransferase involved in cell wall biosynthesis|nr:glycosyltransferase family 4 protein [Aggregatilineaceae bacterium]
MHVLMISLDASLLGEPHGNTVQRHLEYARRIGDLTIVTYNSAASPKTPQHFADTFTVYPTNTRPALFPWVACRLAARIHRETPVDVVTTQDPFATGLVGMLLKWRYGIPLDMQCHSAFFENPDWLAERPLRNRFLSRLAPFMIRRADTTRVLTEREKAIYIKRGVPADRITILSLPTPVDLFAACAPESALAKRRASLGIAPDAPVLVWVGFPAEFKHVELLLDAYRHVCAQRPDARLVMAGDFTTRPDFVRLAQAESVIFAGRVPHDELPMYYQMATLYVHSSRYEGVARVLIEALASGTPVVSTDHLGADVVVRNGETGLLTAHTPEALSAAILDLLNDPARARAMGQAGQRDVLERFAYERQLDAVVETFRRTAQVAGRSR